MSDYSDMMEEALIEREGSDFGGTGKYGKWSFPCSLGTESDEARLSAGGFSLGAHRIITIRNSQLPDPDTDDGAGFAFHAGQILSVADAAGNTYSLKISADGIHNLVWATELVLESVSQNA